MWGLRLNEILLVRIVNNTGESAILSSRIFPRVFLHIGLRFTSDREEFLVEMFILLSQALFCTYVMGAKVKKRNNISSVKFFCAVPHPGHLVWLVVESNHFFHVSLRHSKVSTKWRLNMWGHSEDFSTSTISSWVLTIPCKMWPALFVGFYLPLFFFRQCIILFVWMVHVHYIKFTLHIMFGAPIPILDISGNLILLFLDSPWSNIVNYLNITIVVANSFSVGEGLGSVTSS